MIEVEGLVKRFGQVTAVDDVSFAAHPGRVLALLGPNGAGKSTTLKIVLGLVLPTAGRALVAGELFRDALTPLRTVGVLIDAAAADPAMRGRDHLRWLAVSNRISGDRIEEVLDLVGLETAGGRRVRGYSLGMRQRLGIAAAMLGDPPVLVLDEPATGLDTDGIRWVRSLVRSMAAEGRTVLLSSHLMDEVERCADDLVIISGGRILARGSLADFAPARGSLEDAYTGLVAESAEHVGRSLP